MKRNLSVVVVCLLSVIGPEQKSLVAAGSSCDSLASLVLRGATVTCALEAK